MKNLIAGGAGFLGSHLAYKLLSLNEEVICIDNLCTGAKDNLNNLLKEPKFQFIKHDIEVPIDLNINRIWHLASPASRLHYEKKPIKTALTNSLGTYNLLNLATKNKAEILLASTSEIYGVSDNLKYVENQYGGLNPISKKSCYAEGKRFSESMFLDFFRTHNTKIRIARIFNTYGPHMLRKDGRVISNFIYNALQNKSIKIYGNGKQTRSFCYVDDLIEGLIKLMNSDYVHPVNLGNDNEEVSIIGLSEMIMKKINSKSKIIFCNLPEEDVFRRRPTISLARDLINWNPTVSLSNGLDETINSFQEKI